MIVFCQRYFHSMLTGLFENVAKPQSGFNHNFSFGRYFVASSTLERIESTVSISSVRGFITPRPSAVCPLILGSDNNELSSPALGVENSRVKSSGLTLANNSIVEYMDPSIICSHPCSNCLYIHEEKQPFLFDLYAP